VGGRGWQVKVSVVVIRRRVPGGRLSVPDDASNLLVLEQRLLGDLAQRGTRIEGSADRVALGLLSVVQPLRRV
jgi:hypothetical protein